MVGVGGGGAEKVEQATGLGRCETEFISSVARVTAG